MRTSHRRALSLLIAIQLGCILAATPRVDASSGGSNTLPYAPLSGTQKFSKLGHRITVDNTWVEGFGYRPLRITFETQVASTSDRNITFEISLNNGDRHFYDDSSPAAIRVSRDFVLPAGKTTVDTTLLIPGHDFWQPSNWAIKIDGQQDKELSERNQPLQNPSGPLSTQALARIAGFMQGQQGPSGLPRVLVVGDLATDANLNMPLTKLLSALIEADSMSGLSSLQGTNLMANVATAHYIHFLGPGDLPKRWLEYTSFDVICLSKKQLLTLSKTNPSALTAIRRWVTTGGTLWVYGVGSEWQGVPLIESSFELGSPSKPATTSTPNGEAPAGWQLPDGSESTGYIYNSSSPNNNLLNSTASFGSRSTREPSAASWAWRPVGMGQIFAFMSKAPFETEGDQLEWVLGTMSVRRADWGTRHGGSPILPTNEFWNFVIPGIGVAPVGGFQIFITLFVLIIGPANYLLLRRLKRLQLMILTVPLGAVFVFGTVLGYALMTDGLSTRVRVRSYSELDQRAGEEVIASRLSYYAGMTSAEGLAFSDQTAIYPIHLQTHRSRSRKETPRGLSWDESRPLSQQFTHGWLKSRTPTQYLSVTARSTKRKLEISGSGKQVDIENFLGHEIQQLLVSDHQGNLHWAEAIGKEQQAKLEPIELEKAQQRLRSIFNDTRPTFSGDFDHRQNTRPDYYFDDGKDLPSKDLFGKISGSLFESQLQAAMLRLKPSPESPWRERTYLAILKETDDDLLGVSGASQEANFHVILGRY